MNHACAACNKPFEISADDLRFYERASPKIAGQIQLIPPPQNCPECRQQLRLAFRNERSLYHRTCSFSGKNIISIYSPDKPYTVYHPSIWWSDNWSPFDYGREFDFTRTFFEQFNELSKAVPKLALNASNNENSDYVNFALNCKNCYLILGWGENCEDCLYGRVLLNCKDCVDVNFATGCEVCYECTDIENCYGLFYSESCKNCSESYYLKNCIGCRNCFGCINLVNKQYYFLNEEYSKHEYQQLCASFLSERLRTYEQRLNYRRELTSIFASYPQKYFTGINVENSFGNYLKNCKNAAFCYDTSNAEDVKYLNDCIAIKDCMDCSVAGENHTELSYQCVNYTGYHGLFLNLSWFCKDLLYCQECFVNSHDCFGCVGLRHNEYCILNKQYTRAEYEVLVPKIIEHMTETGEWGEFFPGAISPFGYNETMAQQYFPLTAGQAGHLGFNWSNYESPPPEIKQRLKSTDKLGTAITDVANDARNNTMECAISKKFFRLVESEMQFYQRHNLPLPTYHPDIRFLKRFELRNPRKLWDRVCARCKTELLSTFAPERPEIIYCEECYHREVFG